MILRMDARLLILVAVAALAVVVVLRAAQPRTPEHIARDFVRVYGLGDADDVHCNDDGTCSIPHGVLAVHGTGDDMTIEGAYFSRSELNGP